MKFIAFQSAAACKPVVTATSTNIYALINTAGSTTVPRAGFPEDTNAIDITVEANNARILWGGTPTATNGVLLTAGNTYRFCGVQLEDLNLIRVTNDVTLSVALGKSHPGEASFIAKY